MVATSAPKKKGKIDTDNKAEESGEVNCKVVPIFNVRPDPTAKRPKDMRWLIEIKECTRQEILDKFGKKENKYRVTNEILDEIKETYRTQRDTMYRIPDEQDDDSEAFILRELWERPSQYYEKGRFIVTCFFRTLSFTGKTSLLLVFQSENWFPFSQAISSSQCPW